MVVKTYSRGWPIILLDGEWVWEDSLIRIDEKEKPCKRCGKMPTEEGYDACLGYIEGYESACCGHGVGPKYVR